MPSATFARTYRADDAAAIVGAGVIIDRAGLVLTQYLAVHEGDQHTVTTIDRTTYPATIRAADPRSGLAVLAIDTTASPLQRAGSTAQEHIAPGSFPAIRFGDADTLRKGQFVIAIGNPFAIKSDGQPTASWGIVTNLARKAPAGTNLNDAPGPASDYRTTLHHLGTLIQTDAKLGWSTGGGALVNLARRTGRPHDDRRDDRRPRAAGRLRDSDERRVPAHHRYAQRRPRSRVRHVGRRLRAAVARHANGADFPADAHASLSRAVLRHGPGSQAGDVVTRVGDKPVNDVDDVQLAVSLLPPATTTDDRLRAQRPARNGAADCSRSWRWPARTS